MPKCLCYQGLHIAVRYTNFGLSAKSLGLNA